MADEYNRLVYFTKFICEISLIVLSIYYNYSNSFKFQTALQSLYGLLS